MTVSEQKPDAASTNSIASPRCGPITGSGYLPATREIRCRLRGYTSIPLIVLMWGSSSSSVPGWNHCSPLPL